MSEPEHFVQFYEADEFLLNSLGGFIGAGLAEGNACIAVATKEHREAFDERLRANWIDVAAERACGQCVSLDASETLSRFMVEEHRMRSVLRRSSAASARARWLVGRRANSR